MKHLCSVALVLFMAFSSCPADCPDPGDPPGPEDYVITTNFSGGQFVIGGKEPDDIWESHQVSYDDYPLMRTDATGIRQKMMDGYTGIDEITGKDLTFIGYSTVWNTGLYGYGFRILEELSLQEIVHDGSCENVQIVFNHLTAHGAAQPREGATFTAFFPPYFDNDPERGTPNDDDDDYRYPIIVINPGYGTTGSNGVVFKTNVTDETETTITRKPRFPNALGMTKSAYALNQKGAVVVEWNMGGYHCLGVNYGARDAFNAFIQELHEVYGCDKEMIITTGASRGGFGALTIAENALQINDQGEFGDYEAIAVLANCPPVRLGDLAQNPIATQPIFSGRWTSILGADENGNDASKYNHFNGYYAPYAKRREPPCKTTRVFDFGFNPSTDPENNPLSFDDINAMCPDYPENLAHLEGKLIVLSCGTKDGFFPYNYFLEMDQALNSCLPDGSGIDHTTFSIIQGSHAANPNDIRTKILNQFLRAVFCSMDNGLIPADHPNPNAVIAYLSGFGTQSNPYSSFNINEWWRVWELGDPSSDYELIPHYSHGQGFDAHNYRMLRDIVNFSRTFTDIIPLAEPPLVMTVPAHLGCDVFNMREEGAALGFQANEPGVIYLSGAPGKSATVTLNNRVDGNDAEVTITRSFSTGQLTSQFSWWPACCDWMKDDQDNCFDLCSTMDINFFPGTTKILPAGQIGHIDWTVDYGITDTSTYDYPALTNWRHDSGDHIRVPFTTDVGIETGDETINRAQPYPSRYYYEEERSYAAASFGVDTIPPVPYADLEPTENNPDVLEISIGHCVLPAIRYYSFQLYMYPASYGADFDPLYIHKIHHGGKALFPANAEYPEGPLVFNHDLSTFNPASFPDFDFWDGDGFATGNYIIKLIAFDATPPPYNQPPYPQSGDGAMFTGIYKAEAACEYVVE